MIFNTTKSIRREAIKRIDEKITEAQKKYDEYCLQLDDRLQKDIAGLKFLNKDAMKTEFENILNSIFN